MNDDLQKKLDELSKNADVLIASPETIEHLQKNVTGVKSTVVPYAEYLDKLFTEKRKLADVLVEQMPHLDPRVGNGSIEALYNEVRECFVFGVYGAAITLSVIMLEFACRERLFQEMEKRGESPNWNKLEKKLLSYSLEKLHEYGVFTDEEHAVMESFATEIRNSYLHYKIKKLIKDMVLEELKGINVHTGEIILEHNVRPADKPFLWFSAKKVLDRDTMLHKVTFCIHWVNTLLGA